MLTTFKEMILPNNGRTNARREKLVQFAVYQKTYFEVNDFFSLNILNWLAFYTLNLELNTAKESRTR
jgi:hypothetical protein